MSDNTKKLLATLAEDPETVERFKQSPETVMNEFNVPADHQKLILDGDREGLKTAANLDDEQARWVIV